MMDADLRQQLGVSPKSSTWTECDPNIYLQFVQTGDIYTKYDSIIAEMLNDNIRVLIYAGMDDLMCNYLGQRKWLSLMKWDG